MAEHWWCKAQERLADKLVLFSCAGMPRWPGIVVPPKPKSELMSGHGMFYPPKEEVFEFTWVAKSYGRQKWHAFDAGEQKVGKRKVIRKPISSDSNLVLVYSLGDELYKWVRPNAAQLRHPVEEHLEQSYSFPQGWGRQEKTAKAHLIDFLEHRCDGPKALRELEDEIKRRRAEKKRAREHMRLQNQYQQLHCLPGLRLAPDSDSESVQLPPDVDSPGIQLGSDSDSDSVQLPFRNLVRQQATPAKRCRGPVPANLRGEVCIGGAVERADATGRQSTDKRKRALAILGLSGTPSEMDIKRAYRLKAREHHPDKAAPHLRASKTKEMVEISWAYEVLTKEEDLASCEGLLMLEGR